AMEDALVLADCLRRADSVERALEVYVRRRRPRADWVQEQSRAAAQAWVLPTGVRNAALRGWGPGSSHTSGTLMLASFLNLAKMRALPATSSWFCRGMASSPKASSWRPI